MIQYAVKINYVRVTHIQLVCITNEVVFCHAYVRVSSDTRNPFITHVHCKLYYH